MDKTIKLRLGPKAHQMFARFVTATALYAGPEYIETVKTTVCQNPEENRTYVEVEPQTVKVNRSLSQRFAGRVVNFITNRVEVESKSQAK